MYYIELFFNNQIIIKMLYNKLNPTEVFTHILNNNIDSLNDIINTNYDKQLSNFFATEIFPYLFAIHVFSDEFITEWMLPTKDIDISKYHLHSNIDTNNSLETTISRLSEIQNEDIVIDYAYKYNTAVKDIISGKDNKEFKITRIVCNEYKAVEMNNTINFTDKATKNLAKKVENKYKTYGYWNIIDKVKNTTNPFLVVDSYIPTILSKNSFTFRYIDNDFKNSHGPRYTISRWFAKEFMTRAIPITHLLELIGFSLDEVKELVKKVKRKKMHLLMVGLGGAGTNFIVFLYEICLQCGIKELFKTIKVFDRDTLEFCNLLRFVDINSRNNYDSCKVNNYYSSSLEYLTKNKRYIYKEHFYPKIDKQDIKPNTIVYGSMENERNNEFYEMFKELDYNYNNIHLIDAGHRGDTLYFEHNIFDRIEADMLHNTYGSIDLNIYFLNQLRAVVKTLEVIANSDPSCKMEYSYIDKKDRDSICKIPYLVIPQGEPNAR